MRQGERAEILRVDVRGRFEAEVTAALRRRLPSESKLAGALRALFPVSPGLRNVVNEAAQVLLRRRSFDRELYASSVRSLAELDDKRAAALLRRLTPASASSTAQTAAVSCSP